ncbi:hypothetical protein [Thermoleptolyngbya sp.]
MKTWNQLKQLIYKVAIAFSFIVLMLFTASPALAFGFGNQPSAPNEGVEKLDGIYEKAEEALDSGLQSMEEVRDRARKGINEVQENADADKMNRPSNSRQATTIQEKAERALEKATQNR